MVAIVNLHCILYGPNFGFRFETTIDNLSKSLWFGMDLFFILSGFLIGSILMYGMDKMDSAQNAGLMRFYLRRALRILPLYYVVLFTLALTPGTWGRLDIIKEGFYLSNYPFSLFYKMPWSWSLSIEEHFYLFVPLLILILRKFRTHRSRIITLVLLWILGLTVRLLTYFFASDEWNGLSYFVKIYTPTHTRFDILIAGVLIAYLSHHFPEKLSELMSNTRNRILCLIIPIGIFLMIIIPSASESPHDLFRSEYFSHLFYMGTATSVAFGCLILWAVYWNGAVHRFLACAPMVLIATLAYGIYLVHLPVLFYIVNPIARQAPLLNESSMASWGYVLALTLIISALISYALHIGIEKPVLWFRDQYLSR